MNWQTRLFSVILFYTVMPTVENLNATANNLLT